MLSSEVVEEDISLLKAENKVAPSAPDFGRDSTMVSQQDRPTIMPRFSTQGGDMFGRMTDLNQRNTNLWTNRIKR